MPIPTTSQNDRLGRVLLIIAGFSGSGKTTVINKVLSGKLQIFPESFHDRLLLLKKLKDQSEPTQRKKHGSDSLLFSGGKIDLVAKLKELPDTAVMHLDLLSLLVAPNHYAGQPTKLWQHYFPRKLRTLDDHSINQQLMRLFVQQEFFNQFDNIAINTVVAPWETIKSRWLLRAEMKKKTESARAACFNNDLIGKPCMDSAITQWANAIDLLNPAIVTQTENYGRKIVVKRRILPNHLSG